ncbi:energy transducer TonB [Xanthocytophaga agilis]|uniref:Energy transducer TonB n=1 Tax=Xanthocytophaga agilis TaxID=3048010 RepID=A0AAE3R4P8_9BACT|nr:energy transducer TonB [Xanthocytophaga agilis]MDJ1503135.1 energy transducer TonB [Xanthocytophaga agilis]
MYLFKHSIKKQLSSLIIALLVCVPLYAQDSSTEQDSSPVNGNVSQLNEVQPEFPGGMEKLSKFLKANLKYPKAARKAHITGKVICSFVIDADGFVQEVFVTKGIGYGCDEEAARVLKLMPQWKPGLQNNQKVPVRYSFPISFGHGQ